MLFFMTISFKSGDLFDQRVDALVNTVNCVGVMGKGVALEFKRRWPENFKAYKRLCETKWLKPGVIYIHQVSDLLGNNQPRFIINFPTKDHWKSKSKIEFIESGLDTLVNELRGSGIKSIALPPLGCGNGGLDWKDVRPLIVDKLNELDIQIIVMEPHQKKDPSEYRVAEFSMTLPRAMLLKSLGDLEHIFHGEYDRITLQKLTYFLQALGTQFNLKFSRNLFGPYSDTLRKSFIALEKQGMIKGFTAAERLTHVTPGAYALADDYICNIGKNEEAQSAIEKLSRLIQGYESPFGLELLSSVHHLASAEGFSSLDDITKAMVNWSEDKRNNYPKSVIKVAYDRLREDGLIASK
jgi:O-acetyl-ADP-ribose deacetylase (regulator of RNase III)